MCFLLDATITVRLYPIISLVGGRSRLVAIFVYPRCFGSMAVCKGSRECFDVEDYCAHCRGPSTGTIIDDDQAHKYMITKIYNTRLGWTAHWAATRVTPFGQTFFS